MINNTKLKVRDFISKELKENKYEIYANFEIEYLDISFNVLAESTSRRVIFLVEIVNEVNIRNNLNTISINVEGLKQIFALTDQNRMIFLILILNMSKTHVLEAMEEFKKRRNEYIMIIIDTKDFDLSTKYYEVYLRSILPTTTFFSPKRKIDSDLIIRGNLEKFFNQNPIIRHFKNHLEEKSPNYESIIQKLLRDVNLEINNYSN